MENLLFDNKPLHLDKIIAKTLGLNEAIILHQIHLRLEMNKDNGTNYHDRRYWTFDSVSKWQQKYFEFWSYETVKRTFTRLEKLGILITGNYNKMSWDNTKWYSIDYKMLNRIVKKINSESTST